MIGRIFTRIVATAGIAAVALTWSAAAQAQEFGSPELIAAAKAEGKLVYYTANFAEVEQQVIKAFNKRFPEIKIEMVRAPGGQLITRVKTEAAAGKLIAAQELQLGVREDAHRCLSFIGGQWSSPARRRSTIASMRRLASRPSVCA